MQSRKFYDVDSFFDAIFSAFWAGFSRLATSAYAQNKHTVRVVVVQVPWISAIVVYGVAVVSSFDFVGYIYTSIYKLIQLLKPFCAKSEAARRVSEY